MAYPGARGPPAGPSPSPAPMGPPSGHDSNMSLQSLESLLSPLRYSDRSRVARDVLGLLRNSNSLTYKVGQFVQANGASDTLLQLYGTTPIFYKGNSYNIPVCIWLPEPYPHRPPVAFVTPTRNMRIKDGHLHVDRFGMVYLPYLNQWNPHTSNLLEMVTIMSSVFSQDPPVFKVPAAQQRGAAVASPPQSQMHAQQPQPQHPAHPSNHPSPSSHASPSHPSPAAASESDPRAARKNQLLSTLTGRMRQLLQDELSIKTLLVDDLLAAQAALRSHAVVIEDEVKSLQAEAEQCDKAASALQAKSDELESWLKQYEGKEKPEVDKMFYVKDTWSKQLLDNVCLDNALQDAFYLLDRSLAEGHIDIASYTKQLRNLARKQFYARQLANLVVQTQQQQAAQQPNNGPFNYSVQRPMPMQQ